MLRLSTTGASNEGSSMVTRSMACTSTGASTLMASSDSNAAWIGEPTHHFLMLERRISSPSVNGASRPLPFTSRANGPGEALLRKPISGTAGSCALATSGHAAAPPRRRAA
jgi:hypothetical protein